MNQTNYYAAAYPNGIGKSPRTLRVFAGTPAAPGYRATVQARDITPSERRALQSLNLSTK